MNTISMLASRTRAIGKHYSANTSLWAMFAGLAMMFIPTFWDLLVTTGLWMDDEHAHGPLILCVSLWLLWTRWNKVPDLANLEAAPALAWLCLLVAAALYIPGRALDIIYFETAAFIWAMTGIVFMAGGRVLFHAVKFPLFFMIFMVPLPNSLVGPLTNWLKLAVSNVTVETLSLLGLPIAQAGVTLSIGNYDLLVSDACSGMRTLFMLEAMGILYLSMVRHPSMLRNIMLPIFIIPISFVANVIRVIVLVLITYYFGDEAGQGFMHGFAGIVLFLAGLLIMLSTDKLLRKLSERLYGK